MTLTLQDIMRFKETRIRLPSELVKHRRMNLWRNVWKCYWRWSVLVCLSQLILQLTDIADALSLAPVYWNSSNSLFKASSSSESIEVQPGDDIDLVCPYYSTNTSIDPAFYEYYIIYQVSQVEYDACTLYSGDTTTHMLINCSAPTVKLRYTVIFEQFPSIPNVPEYLPGQTYYFMSTSTGSLGGLSNPSKGACADLNMKLSVSVCCSTSGGGSNAGSGAAGPAANAPLLTYGTSPTYPPSISGNLPTAAPGGPGIVSTSKKLSSSALGSASSKGGTLNNNTGLEPQLNYQRTNSARTALFGLSFIELSLTTILLQLYVTIR